jgi:hypothetical protein
MRTELAGRALRRLVLEHGAPNKFYLIDLCREDGRLTSAGLGRDARRASQLLLIARAAGLYPIWRLRYVKGQRHELAHLVVEAP